MNLEAYHQSFYLPISNYTVSSDELNEGFVSHPFLNNQNEIFYLGATIAPTDYCSQYPDYLEHPQGVFDYYRSKGVTALYSEEKRMGCRAYFLVFRNPEHALAMGFRHAVTVNSRSGVRFFNDTKILDELYQDLLPWFDGQAPIDAIIFEAEVEPWTIKSEKLIEQDFRLPGEASFLWHSNVSDAEKAEQSRKFLDTLNLFAKKGEIAIYPFQLLAMFSIVEKCGGSKIDKFTMGFYSDHGQQWNEDVYRISGKYFKHLPPAKIDLNHNRQVRLSIEDWENYCANGGEGFVYKIPIQWTHTSDGYLIQPAMKVRGKDYLRLIYGENYLEKDFLAELLAKRAKNTRRKRQLAIQETELSVRILRSFLAQNEDERIRSVAAFLGVDSGSKGGMIDRTL